MSLARGLRCPSRKYRGSTRGRSPFIYPFYRKKSVTNPDYREGAMAWERCAWPAFWLSRCRRPTAATALAKLRSSTAFFRAFKSSDAGPSSLANWEYMATWASRDASFCRRLCRISMVSTSTEVLEMLLKIYLSILMRTNPTRYRLRWRQT